MNKISKRDKILLSVYSVITVLGVLYLAIEKAAMGV